MKKDRTAIDELLLNYLDGNLNTDEVSELEKRLDSDEDMTLRLETLKLVDSSLSNQTLESPSRNFTQLVMEGLYKVPAKNGFSFRNGILIIVGVMTVVAILAILVSTGTFDGTGVIQPIQPEQIGLKENLFNFKLPAISINGKLLINSIIVLNLAIAFIVIDRTILRPLFERRMKVH